MKSFIKKAAAVTMSLAVALSSVAFLPQEAGVVEAAATTSTITPVSDNSTYDLQNYSNRTVELLRYTVGEDIQTSPFDILVTKDNAYNGDINSTIGTVTMSENGVVYADHWNSTNPISTIPTDTKYCNVSAAGQYRIYYRNASTGGNIRMVMCTVTNNGSDSSSSSSTSSGPQFSTRSMRKYGYGVDFVFRVTNETCDYEWHIYNMTPSNNNKVELDGGTGYTSDKNDDICISTNNLEKNKTYYLSLRANGDNTKRTNYYSDNGTSANANSYYSFKTANSETWASGTSGTSGTTTGAPKKNADGTITTTSTSTENGVKTKTEKTTG